MKPKEIKPQYDKVRKEIKDLLYKPYNEKFANYSRLDLVTLVLIALDLIFDRMELKDVSSNNKNNKV